MSLRAYLTALMLATLLPIAILAAVLGYFLVEEQRETFRRGAEERALAMTTALDAELQSSIATLQALSTLPALDEGDLATFRDRAARVLATQGHWVTINLALPPGQQVMNLRLPPDAALPDIAKLDPFWHAGVKSGAPWVSDLVVGPVTRQWDFAIRVPVIRDGALKYVLSAVVKPRSIATLLERQSVPAGWVAVVLDRSDRIVARTVDSQGSVGKLASQSLREALKASPSGWFRGSTIEGATVYTPYRRSEATGWAFAMGIPATVVDAVAQDAMWTIGSMLLGVVVLAISLATFIGRRIARPISSLASATEAIGRGEPIAIPQSAPIAEVRTLAHSLHGAVEALREREQSVRDSDERYRSLVSVLTDIPWTTDAEGAFVAHQPAWSQYTGQSWEELRGFGWANALHADDRAAVRALWESAVLTHANYESRGRLWHAASKEYRHFIARATPLLRPDGSVREWVGTCTDVHAEKLAQEATLAASRAKDEFLAMLSHELRNPLAALTTAAYLLRVSGPASANAGKARDVIVRQTDHMAKLIEDLLDISRLTMGKADLRREVCDLAEIVKDLAATWSSAGRFAAHQLVLEPDPVWIDADRTRMQQIISNLLDNALKYTPEGRVIRIRVRSEEGAAVLEVSDAGEGIAEQDLGRIFDPFAQGEQSMARSRGGMGIGLALVKRIVDLHGGSVAAASEGSGRGATLTVRLPKISEPAVRQLTKPLKVSEGSRRVLIIEDNDDMREMLRAALAVSGHDVRAAPDGAAGLAAAASVRPDIALIDIGLPDIDGYEVARRMRAAQATSRSLLVALTGYGQSGDRERARAAGFDMHLTKPVATEDLKGVIGMLRAES